MIFPHHEARMHIALILDGNRRFAKKHNLPYSKGHLAGAKKVADLIKWCLEENISMLTLYTFSMENFNRTPSEVKSLFTLFRSNLRKLRKKLYSGPAGNDIKIRFIGRLHLLPADIYKDMQNLMKETEKNQRLTVNFAVAYGGRAEIVDAIKKILKKAKRGD